MKKKALIIAMLIVALAPASFGQRSESKFQVQLSYGFGSAAVQNEGFNARLGAVTTEVRGVYMNKENLGFGVGLAIQGLNGTSFNEKGNFNQTRGILGIPVFLSSSTTIAPNTHFLVDGGLRLNRVIEDTYEYLNSTEEIVFENWMMGVQSRFGISYDIRPKASIGFCYDLQYNFADFKGNSMHTGSRMATSTADVVLSIKL